MRYKLNKSKHDPERRAREKRSSIHGIEVREDGHDTPPKNFPTGASAYADPVNYMYPLHDEAHIRNALARFSQHRGQYSTEAQRKVYARIVRAALRNDIDVKPDKALTALLPERLQNKFNKFVDNPILVPIGSDTLTTAAIQIPGADSDAVPSPILGSCETITIGSATNFNFDNNYPASVFSIKGTNESDKEELVKKSKHQALPGPQKLASKAKESEDGVIVVEGRYIGSTFRQVYAVVFDNDRFDEDIRDTYLETYFYASGYDITSGHGITRVELHDQNLFADESFDIIDPAIQGLPLFRSTPTSVDKSELEAVAKSGPISFYVPFGKGVATIPGKDMVIRSVIYPADRTDAHNDYATAVDLEKAAHGWMMHSQQLNVEHTEEAAEGILPAESYIAKAYDSQIDAYPGDWCGVFYARSEKTKNAVSEGVYKGFSIEGGCSKIPEGSRKRMTNILVTKISLVKDPATMLEWVAKGKDALTPVTVRVETEGNVSMKVLKSQLDGLQEQIEKLGSAVGSEIPKLFPAFKSAATEAEQNLNLMHDQVTYIAKFVESSLVKISGLLEQSKSCTKDIVDAKEALTKAQAELADVQRLNDVLNEIPQVQSFHEKLLAEITGGSRE